MTHFALYVELKAKPGKEEEVAAFLANARSLVLAEAGTVEADEAELEIGLATVLRQAQGGGSVDYGEHLARCFGTANMPARCRRYPINNLHELPGGDFLLANFHLTSPRVSSLLSPTYPSTPRYG